MPHPCPCESDSLLRRPARSTSAARAPRCTTGSSPAGPGATSCCGSRTPTASAPPRRTSTRSSTRCAGSGSTGTRARSPRRARRPPPRALERLLDSGHAYRSPPPRRRQGWKGTPGAASAARTRATARSGCACPTRARPSSTTSIRGDARFDHVHIDDFVIARADGSRALQPRRRDRRPRRRHHPRRPRRGPPLQHAEPAAGPRGARRRRRRSTPTCRCCTAPTARSSPSATAPRRSRSCATPATCPRRCATTSRCSAGARRRDDDHADRADGRELRRSSASRSRRRSSTSRSCAG